MELNAVKKVRGNAKMLAIHLKVCDEFAAKLFDQDGAELADYEGYVPGFMPGQHFGDYLILNIDIDTGQITNWKPPTVEDLESFIEGDRK